MKRFFAVILTLTFCAVSTFAQNETDWKNLAPSDEEFSVEAPISLRRDQSADNGAYSRFHTNLNGTYFYIFSETLKEKHYSENVRKFLSLSQKSGTVGKIGEFESENFEFASAEDFHFRVSFIKTKNRLFIFQTVCPTKDNSSVNRFFESIKIKEIPVFDSPIQSKETTADKSDDNLTQKTDEKKLPQIVSGVGSGTGNGSGNTTAGSGIGTGQTNQSSTLTNETKALTILSKPRPNYTDAARFYSIQGTVTLRITFSANGTIGKVDPVTKLPFGLTTEAITAAKRLTFKPAIKNGVTYEVTKQVQFSFVIY